MKKKCLALFPLIALGLTGCDLGGNNIPASAEKGDKGDKGNDGLDGKDGESLLTGKGAPSYSLGKDGDSYVDTLTWDYYTKSNGKWTKAGNFKGGKGDKGNDAVTYVPCIFKNYDGTTLYEFYYEKGTDVVYDGPAPEKKEKDENGKDIPWTFVGWDKSLENIQKPTIFTAQFECRYTCTFLNYDGSDLYKTKVNRGEDVVYKGKTPTRPNSKDGNTIIQWTFSGWDKKLTGITEDTVFIAQYNSPNALKCKFVNYDGSLLGYSYCGIGGTATYTGKTPIKASVNSDGVITGYQFTGWDKPLTNIQESTTFTAVYEEYTSYECRFLNYDGSLLYTSVVLKDGTAKYDGEKPYRDYDVNSKNGDGTANVVSYKFSGWDKDLSTKITAPTTFTAKYDGIPFAGYKTVFQRENGKELGHSYTKKGENAVCGYRWIRSLIQSSYSFDKKNVTRFAGWKESTADIQSDRVFTANIVTISRQQNGEYPQTRITDSSLIFILQTITNHDAQYFYSYQGEKYAYRTDGTNNFWSRVDPIQWRFLSQEGDNVQFVSEKILNNNVWNGTKHEDGIYPSNYKYSDIRKWLNNDFFQQAFYYDSFYIQTVKVDNSAASTYDFVNKFACEDTLDKIYLLSYQDVNNEDYGFIDDTSRIAYDWDGNAREYWLRSPLANYGDIDSVWVVAYAGQTRYWSDHRGTQSYSGIRPALTMKFN